MVETYRHDLVIVGSGIAGLRAAIEARPPTGRAPRPFAVSEGLPAGPSLAFAEPSDVGIAAKRPAPS